MRERANDRMEPEGERREPAADQSATSNASTDPNDVVPVPAAMEPAEIDERAQVVEALRKGDTSRSEPRSRDDSSMREPSEP